MYLSIIAAQSQLGITSDKCVKLLVSMAPLVTTILPFYSLKPYAGSTFYYTKNPLILTIQFNKEMGHLKGG